MTEEISDVINAIKYHSWPGVYFLARLGVRIVSRLHFWRCKQDQQYIKTTSSKTNPSN
ncbi:hypothetical protein Hanom_Chr01g00066121 [Helianthus anomalus]